MKDYYDLFNKFLRKRNSVFVISPYFDIEFAKNMIKKINPEEVIYVVDDGSDRKDLDKLKRLLEYNCVESYIALGSAPGIVHLKVFYIISKNKRNRIKSFFSRYSAPRKRSDMITARFLMLGSANATDAAFGGKRNAELMVSIDLNEKDERGNNDQDLIDFLELLKSKVIANNKTSSPGFSARLGEFELEFPGFVLSPLSSAPGFDAWLQRGLLVAEYKNDQRFLFVVFALIKNLPKSAIHGIFSNAGFTQISSTKVLRYPYIGQKCIPVCSQIINNPLNEDEDFDEGEDFDEDFDEDEGRYNNGGLFSSSRANKNWKSNHCLWTHLGLWVSNECHQQHGDVMYKKNHNKRNNEIALLKNNKNNPIFKKCLEDGFIAQLQTLWDNLVIQGTDPQSYLINQSGVLDRGYYRGICKNKIETDIILANNRDFEKRYTTGYEFLKVPRFRQDDSAWELFVDSFCESLELEAQKAKSSSLILKAIKRAFEALKPRLSIKSMSVTDIKKTLRDNWDKEIKINGKDYKFGDVISNYF
ncbi:phospholipase D-like domain-containing protein [Imhoffiella purpurea]|uniref:hypothetical protein n=1 Tax=Imhoffiella purpurea TaxID=1249627 RepID=UPI0012FD34EC|nr:hypothetical protein [Imhoffiella purpurea]